MLSAMYLTENSGPLLRSRRSKTHWCGQPSQEEVGAELLQRNLNPDVHPARLIEFIHDRAGLLEPRAMRKEISLSLLSWDEPTIFISARITRQAGGAQTPLPHLAGSVRARLLPHHNTVRNHYRPDQRNRCSW